MARDELNQESSELLGLIDEVPSYSTFWTIFALLNPEQNHPYSYDNLSIIPIIARGKNGRIANTADTIEQWIADRGYSLPNGSLASL